MYLAARHPDVFVASGSFSGFVDFPTFHHQQSPASETAVFAVERFYNTGCAGGRPTDEGFFGDPITDDVWWHNANPTELAPNVGGISLYVSSGHGAPCDAADLSDPLLPFLIALEIVSRDMARSFTAALRDARVTHETRFGCGIHDWRYWQQNLHIFWDRMTDAFGAPPPDSFDYRRVDPSFSVWGWRFEADPKRATEFLDIRDASRTGLSLTGSGTGSVTTAGYYHPMQLVKLQGAVEDEARAGPDRGISLRVDLGPPHRHQQYTSQARAAGQDQPGYFKTRTVRLEPRCTVPRLIGRTLRRARRLARAAGCKVGKVKRVRSTRRPGHVRAQRPRPGADRPEAFRITVTVPKKRRSQRTPGASPSN